MNPTEFRQDLSRYISEHGETLSPFSGEPAQGVELPIITRIFNSDFNINVGTVVRNDAGDWYQVISVKSFGFHYLVQLIPCLLPEPEVLEEKISIPEEVPQVPAKTKKGFFK